MFASQPTATVLLDRDLTICATSRSYLETVDRREDDLLGRNLFEAFPENPDMLEAGASKEFTDSVARVLRTQRPHRLHALRYDLEHPRDPGRFRRKRWSIVTAPIHDPGVDGVMVQVEDVTLLDDGLLDAVRAHHAQVVGPARTAHMTTEVVDAITTVVENYVGVAREVANLRQALRSRPMIEQAKGIIMADRKCQEDEAFDLLKRLSMDTNVRIADVAAAVVRQRTRGEAPADVGPRRGDGSLRGRPGRARLQAPPEEGRTAS